MPPFFLQSFSLTVRLLYHTAYTPYSVLQETINPLQPLQLTPCNWLKNGCFFCDASSVWPAMRSAPRHQSSESSQISPDLKEACKSLSNLSHRAKHVPFPPGSLQSAHCAPCHPWAGPFLFFLLQDPLLRYPDDHHAMYAGPAGIFSILRSPPRHGRSSCCSGTFSDRCRSKGSRSTSMATIDPFLFKAKRHAWSQACTPVSGHAAFDGARCAKGGLHFDPNRHQTRTMLAVTQRQDHAAAVTRWIILPKNGRAVCRHRP